MEGMWVNGDFQVNEVVSKGELRILGESKLLSVGESGI